MNGNFCFLFHEFADHLPVLGARGHEMSPNPNARHFLYGDNRWHYHFGKDYLHFLGPRLRRNCKPSCLNASFGIREKE